jgi:hypothetical protein
MSNRKILALAFVGLFPLAAGAQQVPSVGGCGLGSKLFEGQRGVAPQVLAVTTNGTFGNQTFGISSGTLGCNQDGVVRSNWKTAMFIDGNKEKLARDMSVGGGETLDSLAQLLGVEEADRAAFYATTRQNFGRIFPAADASTDAIMASLKQVLAEHERLSAYSAAI